ncbi:putative protein N(5)-glutamine methyltransferase [Nonomuraea sp. NPDC003804]|uniref:putative protein N(5)-glutamine methyltransferase n=1 Tax=Nonomuraea sp. NPDC003804 TaxID=3154547 RepID=UPI0033B37CFC
MPAPSLSLIVTTLRSAGCVFAEDEAELLIATAATPDQLTFMVERRAAGLPLEHVLGWARFCGLRVAVDPGVFVPRRRTEVLARQAIELARRAGAPDRPAVVVDLCCGSGALGAAVATAVPGLELHAADIETAAVDCARRNLDGLGGHVHHGDLLAALPERLRGRVDVLIANVPYVPSREVDLLPAEARVHEPRVALDGGADGLQVMRRVTDAASVWLAPGASLLVETSRRQAPQAVETFTSSGLRARVVTCEEMEATVVIGTPGP